MLTPGIIPFVWVVTPCSYFLKANLDICICLNSTDFFLELMAFYWYESLILFNIFDAVQVSHLGFSFLGLFIPTFLFGFVEMADEEKTTQGKKTK